MDTASYFRNRKKMQRKSEISNSSDYNDNNILNYPIKLEDGVEIKVERIEFEDSLDYDFRSQISEEEFIMEPDIVKIEKPVIVEKSEEIVNSVIVEKPEKIEKPINHNCVSKTIYNCRQCAETFCSNQARSKHYKTQHYNEKLNCIYCQKSYSKLSNLNRHMNYHCSNNDQKEKNNNEKKYGLFKNSFICDLCKKSFTHKNSLITHIKGHYGMSVTYKCPICKKHYTKKHNLKCHINSNHYNTFLYYCKICLRGFCWRFALTSHEKKHHGKNKSSK